MQLTTKLTEGKIYLPLLITALYLIWVWAFVGIRLDHYILLGVFLGLYYIHPMSQKLILALHGYIFYGMFYDSIRVFPNHEFQVPNIQQPYDIEKAIFGIQTELGSIIPCEFFAQHTNVFLDVLAGFFYINWITVPILFAVYLSFKDKKASLKFSYGFIALNLVGFAIYYLYPAAPPWYVEQYGFQFNPDALGYEAGLTGFDQYFGVSIFKDMYSRNPNVYAAIPSLHSAFPTFVLIYGIKRKMGWWNLLFATHAIGIWFSAVYLRHHYIIDVLAGISCAIAGYYLFEYLSKKPLMNNWLNKVAQQI